MNPALSGLRDIHLPPPISWWPPAPGWWLLVALVPLLGLVFYIVLRLRRRNRWRVVALAELTHLRQQYAAQNLSAQKLVGELSVLLRRVAISRFPREQVASLSGEAWLEFLDHALGDEAVFKTDGGRLLSVAPYLPSTAIAEDSLNALLALCERWLTKLPRGRT
ncbi:MAG TPA: DUF4381 domain-containing protein [Rhodocyclaceae bacterium]|nr:DUF4381 domain-containing protein [Rhodocyclaceae bacterium]